MTAPDIDDDDVDVDGARRFSSEPIAIQPRDHWLCPVCGWGTPEDHKPARCPKCGCGNFEACGERAEPAPPRGEVRSTSFGQKGAEA